MYNQNIFTYNFRPRFARHHLPSLYVALDRASRDCSPNPWYVEFSAALRAAPSPFLVRSFLRNLARGGWVQP